jgi:predicted dehydrogenase
MGSRQVVNFSAAGCSRVTRVFDLDAEAARRAASPVDAEVAPSVEACFGDDIDLVVIATPTPDHVPLCLRAMEAGKHVFCEKPLARSLAEGEKAVAAAQREGVKLGVGHVVRFFPAYRTAHDLIQAGGIGRVGMARLSRLNRIPSAWYADYARSGGVLNDLSLHDLDWLVWTFGMPERVYAQNRRQDLPHLDYGLAVLRFAGGEIAHVEGSWADLTGFSTSFDIAGSGGLLRHDSRQGLSLSMQKRGATGAAAVIPGAPEPRSPYVVQAELFVHSILRDFEPPVSGEEGLASLRVSLACLQSAETGQVVVPGVS